MTEKFIITPQFCIISLFFFLFLSFFNCYLGNRMIQVLMYPGIKFVIIIFHSLQQLK